MGSEKEKCGDGQPVRRCRQDTTTAGILEANIANCIFAKEERRVARGHAPNTGYGDAGLHELSKQISDQTIQHGENDDGGRPKVLDNLEFIDPALREAIKSTAKDANEAA